ncbi:hypothetical protein DOTSEDRAFT_24233 [Dothistroma septosporum NZE10]|uniref:Uncharacterized protein n=1 Tax=Dothistroma septosporum (strain NZE10 / CBS 128990) TaxID=675120 RepID=N1PKY6_DOTSN|nr:hypothetical protein DOTSEDRAFT_24233 [Dothistroma septosporum NZE10]
MGTASFGAQFDYMERYEMAYSARSVTKPSSIPNDSLSHLPGMTQNDQQASGPTPKLKTTTSSRDGQTYDSPMPWNTVDCMTPASRSPGAPSCSAVGPLQTVIPASYNSEDDEQAINRPLHRTPSESGSTCFPDPSFLAPTARIRHDSGYFFEENLHHLKIEFRKPLPVGHPERVDDLGLRTVCSIEIRKRKWKTGCAFKRMLSKMSRRVGRWRDEMWREERRGAR